MLRAKINSSLLLVLSCSFSTKSGTKAELKAPSAKILRKKFGNLKAAKNASERRLTPKYFAIIISRINPKMRDKEIKKDTVKTDRSMVLIAKWVVRNEVKPVVLKILCLTNMLRQART